jgi:hypothetical protein
MSIESVTVIIEGLPPGLLMHAFPLVPIEALDKKSPEDQAEHAAYRTPSGELHIPGINVQRSLIAGAAYSKGKGRASLQKPAAACLMVSPEHCIITPQTYEVDARAVVVPATKGRVVRYRPLFAKWSISFTVEYDDTLLRPAEVRRIVDDTGQRVGLLDFRPEKKGPFGRFMVTSWT